VVDDNDDAALALQGGLEALGHIVAIAHDGPSALAAAAIFKPQVGLLDIGLPVMDGYELAVALRAEHDIRLVAITGYGQERDRERSRDAGFDGHLVKPVDLRQIAKALHEITVDATRG
jgi:CheY-like chemotaxis protein